MKNYIVVIGSSARGLEALKSLSQAIPIDFTALILFVMHIHPHNISHLTGELSIEATKLYNLLILLTIKKLSLG